MQSAKRLGLLMMLVGVVGRVANAEEKPLGSAEAQAFDVGAPCGCYGNSKQETATSTSGETSESMPSLIVLENPGSSTETGKYISISVEGGPCVGGTAKGVATAHGPGHEKAKITVTSTGGGGPFTGTGSARFSFDTKGKTITITASSPDLGKDIKGQIVVGTEGRNNPSPTNFQVPDALIRTFEADLEKTNIPFLQGSTLTAGLTQASGSKWDCCLKGKLVKGGYQKASLGGEIAVSGSIPNPLYYPLDVTFITKGGYGVEGSAGIGVEPDVSFTIGVSGNYEKKCDAQKCVTITGTATAGISAKAKAGAEILVKAAGTPVLAAKILFQPAAIDGGAKGEIAYDSCGKGLTSSFCALPITVTLNTTVQVTAEGFPWNKDNMPTIEPGAKYKIWEGTCK